MEKRMAAPRICGITGGVLFAGLAAYNLYLYILLVLNVGAPLNVLTLLTIAESAAIGVLALLDKRGRLLETVAWVEAIHGFVSMVLVALSLFGASMINSVALALIFSGLLGGAASVVLAAVLIIGSCRQGQVRWLRKICFLPALMLVGSAAVSFAAAGVEALSIVLVAVQAVSAWLVCYWVSAPVYRPQPDAENTVQF